MRAAVDMRGEMHAVLGDLAQAAEAVHLEAAGVGEDRALVLHEVVQAAELLQRGQAGAQVEVVGIGEHALGAYLHEVAFGDGLHGALRGHGHEDGRMHQPAVGGQHGRPRRRLSVFM